MSPAPLIELAAALLGLLLGSFLNVCIVRLPRDESIVSPGSRCPNCGAPIRWYDNIPLISFLLLRGRCRACKQPISPVYPLVELASAALLAAVAALFLEATSELPIAQHPSLAVPFVNAAILGLLLLGLAVMDWQTGLLPDEFTLGGIFAAFMFVCTQAILLNPGEEQILLKDHHIRLTSPGALVEKGNVFLTGPEHLIFFRIFGTAIAALVLLAIRALYKRLRKRDGMGLGDVKMLAMIAAFLGFWPAILALFVGVLTASLYAVTLLARRRADASTRLPFGTFLATGGLTAALFGPQIIDAYTSLLQ